MRRIVWLALLVSSLPVLAQQHPAPALSSDAISAEKMALYRDFLGSYLRRDPRQPKDPLHVARTTNDFHPEDFERRRCLEAFVPGDFDNQKSHAFAATAFPKLPVRLIDPKTYRSQNPEEIADVFTFSEIVFDASHTHAVFWYSYWCGNLCAEGETLVYELKDRKWVQTSRSCGLWVS